MKTGSSPGMNYLRECEPGGKPKRVVITTRTGITIGTGITIRTVITTETAPTTKPATANEMTGTETVAPSVQDETQPSTSLTKTEMGLSRAMNGHLSQTYSINWTGTGIAFFLLTNSGTH